MIKENKYIKEFDRIFTRDDGLIDKYSWYGVDGEPHPQPTPKAIKIFILNALKSQRKEIIEKIKEKRKDIRGLDEYDKYNRTEIYKKRKSYNKALREIINLIKEDD